MFIKTIPVGDLFCAFCMLNVTENDLVMVSCDLLRKEPCVRIVLESIL